MTGINNGRVRESDLVGPTLRLLAAGPSGFMSTSGLITELTLLFNPTDRDAEIVPGRNDTYFSQKVRNLISHRNSNFIASGYAEYDDIRQGLTITSAGQALLTQLTP